MKYFTLVIAAFIATLAVAQAQAIPNKVKLPPGDWDLCKTTSDCNAGWSCAKTQNNEYICVDNTYFAKDSMEYKYNFCKVPGTASAAYAYQTYSCPAYGGVGTYVQTGVVAVAPAEPVNVPVVYLPTMLNCDVSRSCNRVIQNATGQNVTDAMCYNFQYVSSDQFTNRSLSNAVDAAGLPDGYNNLVVYKCLTMSQMNGGMNGFSYQDGLLSVGTYVWQMVQSSYGNSVSQNGQVVSNFYMQESSEPNGSGKMQVVRQKIMDFFHYAIIQGSGLNSTMVANDTCASTCGQASFSQMCCAEMTMKNTNWVRGGPTGWQQVEQTDMTMVCINQSVAAADMSMNIAGASVSLKCQENTMSKAMRLVSAGAIALSAYVSI